jgi:protein SCO1/2
VEDATRSTRHGHAAGPVTGATPRVRLPGRPRPHGVFRWLREVAIALCAGLALAQHGFAAQVSAAGPGAAAAPSATVAVPAGDARALRLAQPRALPSFTLTDQHGRPFRSDAAFAGRVSLVFFGFVNCPDVCPTTLLRVRNLLAADSALADVQVVMISVDGERDTPAALKRVLGAISPRFVGLTGDPVRVRPVARSFSASFVKQPPSGPDGAYVVDHSAQLYLVDRSGRLATIFFNAPDETLRAALLAATAAG